MDGFELLPQLVLLAGDGMNAQPSAQPSAGVRACQYILEVVSCQFQSPRPHSPHQNSCPCCHCPPFVLVTQFLGTLHFKPPTFEVSGRSCRALATALALIFPSLSSVPGSLLTPHR